MEESYIPGIEEKSRLPGVIVNQKKGRVYY